MIQNQVNELKQKIEEVAEGAEAGGLNSQQKKNLSDILSKLTSNVSKYFGEANNYMRNLFDIQRENPTFIAKIWSPWIALTKAIEKSRTLSQVMTGLSGIAIQYEKHLEKGSAELMKKADKALENTAVEVGEKRAKQGNDSPAPEKNDKPKSLQDVLDELDKKKVELDKKKVELQEKKEELKKNTAAIKENDKKLKEITQLIADA